MHQMVLKLYKSTVRKISIDVIHNRFLAHHNRPSNQIIHSMIISTFFLGPKFATKQMPVEQQPFPHWKCHVSTEYDEDDCWVFFCVSKWVSIPEVSLGFVGGRFVLISHPRFITAPPLHQIHPPPLPTLIFKSPTGLLRIEFRSIDNDKRRYRNRLSNHEQRASTIWLILNKSVETIRLFTLSGYCSKVSLELFPNILRRTYLNSQQDCFSRFSI